MKKQRPKSRSDLHWKKQWQIPDQQIVDAADQYQDACELLAKKTPLSGVLLPQMNAAAMSIELYLKSLSAERIYTPDMEMPEVSVVSSSPVPITMRVFHTCAPSCITLSMKSGWFAGAKKGETSRQIETIIANMERWRWYPRDLGSAHVIVKPSMPTPLLSETIRRGTCRLRSCITSICRRWRRTRRCSTAWGCV
jgi:hypothetical protein